MKKKISIYLFTIAMILLIISTFSAMGAAIALKSGMPDVRIGVGSEANPTRIVYDGKEWYVIGYNGSGVASAANQATLFAKDCRNFEELTFAYPTNITNQYSQSRLRARMDDYARPLNADNWEKHLIVLTNLPGGGDPYDGSRVAGDDVTGVRFWPLSYDEMTQVSLSTNYNRDYFFLRTPAGNTTGGGHAMLAQCDPNVTRFIGSDCTYTNWMRPAFKLNLASVFLTTDAVNGKPSGASSTLLPVTAASGNTAMKLTMHDSRLSMSAPTTARIAKSGDIISISYTSAYLTFNCGISALLCNSSGEPIYYGRLMSGANSNGTVSFTVPAGLTSGSYKIKLFVEQMNGNNYTDFAGTPIEIPLTVDSTPPVLSSLNADNITNTGARLNFTSNEAGKYYYLVYSASDSAPSAAAVKAQGTAAAKGTAALTVGANTSNFSGLSHSSSYKVYVVLEDNLGNLSAVYDQSFNTPDITPPTLQAWNMSDIALTTAKLNFTPSEAGTYYYLVYLASASAPTAAAVKAQGAAITKGMGAASASANTTSISGLTRNTSYKVYFVLSDAAGNLSGLYTNSFSTSAKLTPTINLTLSRASATQADNIVFSATLSGSGGIFSGTVDFKDNGVLIGSGAVNSSGTASLTKALTVIGQHSITAVYNGNNDYNGVTSAAVPLTIYMYLTNSNPAVGKVYYGGLLYRVMKAEPTNITLSADYDNSASSYGPIVIGPFTHANWSGSYICNYLNDTVKKSFSNAERAAMVAQYSQTQETGFSGSAFTPNQTIVLPSYDEVKDNGTWGMTTASREFYSSWWLRTPGELTENAATENAAYVDSNGVISQKGAHVASVRRIRPTFKLNTSSVFLATDAANGKAGMAGGALTAVITHSDAKLKLTISDSTLTLNASNAPITKNKGSSIELPYTNAKTGANNYVSCIIEQDGKVKYYGKLASAASSSSGTAIIKLPANMPVGGYSLRLFTEQANSGNLTDYAGNTINIPLTVEEKVVIEILSTGSIARNGLTISGSLNYNINNPFTATPSASVILAIYDANGTLIYIEPAAKKTIQQGNNQASFSNVSCQLPQGTAKCTVKLLCWNDIGILKPVTSPAELTLN